MSGGLRDAGAWVIARLPSARYSAAVSTRQRRAQARRQRSRSRRVRRGHAVNACPGDGCPGRPMSSPKRPRPSKGARVSSWRRIGCPTRRAARSNRRHQPLPACPVSWPPYYLRRPYMSLGSQHRSSEHVADRNIGRHWHERAVNWAASRGLAKRQSSNGPSCRHPANALSPRCDHRPW